MFQGRRKIHFHKHEKYKKETEGYYCCSQGKINGNTKYAAAVSSGMSALDTSVCNVIRTDVKSDWETYWLWLL